MRILVVYPYIPFPVDRGTYQRTYHLLRALARDHEVDLLALSEKQERLEQKPHFESFCRRVTLVPFEHPPWPRLFPGRLLNPLPTTILHWRLPQLAEALRQALAERHYDLVHVCDIVMVQYFLREHRKTPLAVDRSRVDLQFQLAQYAAMGGGWKDALLHRENIAKLHRFEKQVARRVKVEVVCGPDDETFIRREISAEVPVLVVANGVDLDYFHPRHVTNEKSRLPTLLFCGAMDYTPNVDALRWYFGEIHAALKAAVPELRLLIVGKSPVDEVWAYAKLPDVVVTGGVPDVRPYYQESWGQMVPLRIGGGTRLKIPESMAMRTPVVSTTIGAQGLDLVHDQDILLADDPQAFVLQAARLLMEPGLRERLELAGADTVQERLGWPGLGGKLSRHYADLYPALTS